MSTNINQNNCPICLNTLPTGYVNLNCNHRLCLDCYSEFKKRKCNDKCPICRINIQQHEDWTHNIRLDIDDENEVFVNDINILIEGERQRQYKVVGYEYQDRYCILHIRKSHNRN